MISSVTGLREELLRLAPHYKDALLEFPGEAGSAEITRFRWDMAFELILEGVEQHAAFVAAARAGREEVRASIALKLGFKGAIFAMKARAWDRRKEHRRKPNVKIWDEGHEAGRVAQMRELLEACDFTREEIAHYFGGGAR